MNVKGVVLVYVFAWLVGTFSVQANMSDDSVVVYERSSNYFFSSDETIEIIVRCDVDELLSDISDKRDWHLGEVAYRENGIEKHSRIRLRTRGNFRRKRSTCSFPPIKFDFPEETVAPTVFNHLKRLKFVTHCRSKGNYEQNMLIEYLIYKLYSVFTDESYRVRLAKVKWVDSKGEEDTVEKWGFFIENTKQMATRLNGRIINIANVHQEKTHYKKIARLSIFQFMVGNTDWGVSTLHNIRLLIRDPYQPPIPIPYDFDWAGIIDAPYAIPLPEFETRSVTQRVYRGFYRSEEELTELLEEFVNKKEEIYSIVNSFNLLDSERKEEVLSYLDSFYEMTSDPKKVKYEFITNCRKDDF